MYISADITKEWIKITFVDAFLFTSMEGLQIQSDRRTISRELPPQLPEEAKEVQEMIDFAVQGVKIVVIVQAATSYLLSASLS